MKIEIEYFVNINKNIDFTDKTSVLSGMPGTIPESQIVTMRSHLLS